MATKKDDLAELKEIVKDFSISVNKYKEETKKLKESEKMLEEDKANRILIEKRLKETENDWRKLVEALVEGSSIQAFRKRGIEV